MTSPQILKRNLQILKLYDSGDFCRKEIAKKLNVNIQVVHDVIYRRHKYEMDIRSQQIKTKIN